MRLELTYDNDVDAWTLRHDAVEISTPADIERWRSALDEELARLGGKRVYLLIDLDGFSLSPAIAHEYGKVAKRVMTDHALGVVRYGSDAGLTTTSIRVAAIVSRFPANIFPDRAAAVRAINRIRKLPFAKP